MVQTRQAIESLRGPGVEAAVAAQIAWSQVTADQGRSVLPAIPAPLRARYHRGRHLARERFRLASPIPAARSAEQSAADPRRFQLAAPQGRAAAREASAPLTAGMEGAYSSSLALWRRARDNDELLAAPKRGRRAKAVDPLVQRITVLEREIRKLAARAERAFALVAFFVQSHNTQMPHAAFAGQTPDEMHSGSAPNLGSELAAGRTKAREHRLATNRALSCGRCSQSAIPQ